jgi:hypothetical protein
LRQQGLTLKRVGLHIEAEPERMISRPHLVG